MVKKPILRDKNTNVVGDFRLQPFSIVISDLVVIQGPIDIHNQQLGMGLRNTIASALAR